MAVQHFTCIECGTKIEDDNSEGVHSCPQCGADMRWDCGGGIAEGDYSHISASSSTFCSNILLPLIRVRGIIARSY